MSAIVLRRLLAVLVEGAQQALRLRIEGRSTGPGPSPAWIESAADFELVQIRCGSTELVLDALPIGSAGQARFTQRDLFQPDLSDRSGLDLFEESMEAATAGDTNSDLYDERLIQTMESVAGVLRHGIESVEFYGRRHLTLDGAAISRVGNLRKTIPPDQHATVTGVINMLRHSDHMFTLVLGDRTEIRGVAVSEEIEGSKLSQLWGRTAKVTGRVKFRPSGAVLRIEAESISCATDADTSLWSVTPSPLLGPLDSRLLERSQGPRTGVAAVFGQLADDECDEEINRMLDQFS